MTDMPDLLRRLEKGGIEVPEHVKKAMLEVDVADFTDYEVEAFFADRPIPFLETDEPLPPTRSNRSTTVTEYPFEPSRIAADKPPNPAPITTA